MGWDGYKSEDTVILDFKLHAIQCQFHSDKLKKLSSKGCEH